MKYRYIARSTSRLSPLLKSTSIVLLASLFRLLLPAQTRPHEEPFQLIPPGVSAKVEKYRDIDQANLRMISKIAVDHFGFMWCASSEGLARFDGYDAKLYRDDAADTLGRAKTAMTSVAVDGEGFVWGASPNGLKRLDPMTGQSRWYMDKPNDTASVGAGDIALLVTAEGELWAGALRGIARFSRESDSFVFFPYPREFSTNSPVPSTTLSPVGLCEIGRSIWVGSMLTGIAEFDRDHHTWKVFKHDSAGGSGPSSNTVYAVCGDRSGALWVGTQIGLERYDPVSNSWRRPGTWGDGGTRIPKGVVYAVAEDDFGGVWIGTGGAGLYRLDQENGHLLHYLHDRADPPALLYNEIPWLNTTRPGGGGQAGQSKSQPPASVVWIPEGIPGASRAIVRKDPYTCVIIRHSEGKIAPAVRALVLDTCGRVWAGLVNDSSPVGIFDMKTRKCRWYAGPRGIARVGRLQDGSIMATTRNAKVWMLDLDRDTFFPVATDLSALSFLEDKDGSVWLGCDKDGMTYLASLDRRTGRYTIYPRQDSSRANLQEVKVTRICEDSRGNLWYGTAGAGLIRFDRERKTYRRYSAGAGSPEALVDNSVITLIPDSAGRLWVGTQAGLDLMDCDRGTFEHMHSPNPTSELLFREMADDGEGHLWIAALPTFACFTKANRTFRWLPMPDKFGPAPVPWGVAFDPRSRTITMGISGGFFFFSLDNPPAASDPPPVVLTSFNVFEKPYPIGGEIWSLKSITIPHSAGFFSFKFAALDFTNSAKNQYSYRLEGLEPDYVLSGSRRYVSYSNLDPGKYVFRVKGTNSEGIWNEEGTSIDIIVLPPWYRTYLAYGAYALLAGSLFYVMRRFDLKRTALKHSLQMKSFEAEKMREVDQMKSRFFANISHEFRTPLTLILGPLDQLTGRFQEADVQAAITTMRRNGLRLLELINQLLDLSRLDSGNMPLKVRSLDLVALSRPLVMSFISLAERRKIKLVFESGEEEIRAFVDRDKFEKILTNLISNAFKFTREGGEVKVVLRIINGENAEPAHKGAHGRWVEVAVSDTGIGIEAKDSGKIFDRFYQVDSVDMPGQGGTGIGLALTKELVELHKGEITVRSTPGIGSTFIVRFPLGKEQWRPEEMLTEETVPISIETLPIAASLDERRRVNAAEEPDEPSRPVVLIVEDNADVRAYVRGLLQKDYGIEEAENGEGGLEKARGRRVDLVISDIMMPVMDGVQLCRELKDDERTNHIPVILLTARATEDGKLEGLDAGADDYVVKPFDARELAARVKNLLELRRTLWEKYHRQVTLGPAETPVTSTDERFLKRFAENIAQHITDAGYDTEKLAHDMCMSRMQLNRKLRALTGHSTHELVRQYRLQRAAQLLRKKAGNVSEVAYELGFSNLSHFARAFREQFGMLPSEYEANGPEEADNANPREP